MPEIVPFAEAGYLFADFKHTAFRLETRRGYASDRAGARYQAFLSGQLPQYEPDVAWNVNVRAAVAAGRRFERVRIVDDPPTDGQRFLLATGLGNVEAGEDIRNIWRADAVRLGLPEFDFWLFDSKILARFHFDADDRTLGVELITDPAEVLAACQARDAAWHFAAPTRDFAARVPSGV
ncbi:DUF6879 family protein [Kitasatospora aureofaciens]|uniref:DUF6879 family protein n=1 Tax=Kitasatospora aureofaciens TaxID=1894 RepID=UPI001C48A17C|nr:DUF6879 family protein [Kitasatospora aureofaciens]MBV6700638.1 hypothetical protein [Kitasatospora aureofaciens]